MASAADVANVLNNTGTMNQIGQNNMAVNNAVSNMYSQLDNILGISQANTATNLGEAALNRQWQEQQAAGVNAFNASEAAKNRSWQEYMSNTAHRREVYDLIAAGLNPILSVSGGNGAAVTSGATASGVMGSGSQGQADTSGTSAMVNVLGKAVDALSQTAASTNSALTNLSVADKYNTFNEYIAGLDRQNQQELAHIHGRYGLAQTDLAGQYNVRSAGIHAAATRYAADQSAAASRYAANVGNQNAIIAANAARYGHDVNAASAEHIQSMKEAHDEFMAENYPTSAMGMASAVTQGVGGFVKSVLGGPQAFEDHIFKDTPTAPDPGDWEYSKNKQYAYYDSKSGSIYYKNGKGRTSKGGGSSW